MSSSTSSSRPGARGTSARKGRLWRCVGLFALSFAATAALATLAGPMGPFGGAAIAEVRARIPADPDYRLTLSDVETLDHHVYAHDLFGVSEPLRAADVLVLGSSRVLVGLPGEPLDAWFAARGLRVYHLGFPAGTSAFARRLIERYDLRPALAIVDVSDFFRSELSHFEQRALRESRFDAQKRRLELGAAFLARRHLHRWLPHPAGLDRWPEESWVVYRSVRNGSWLPAAQPVRSQIAVGRAPDPFAGRGLPRRRLHEARDFVAWLTSRGTRVVLSQVPGAMRQRWRAERYAAVTGAPLVAPQLANLWTLDGTHLTPESAQRYARAFLASFEPPR